MECCNCFLLIRRLKPGDQNRLTDEASPEIKAYVTWFAEQGHVAGQTAYLAADLAPIDSPPLSTTGKCFSRWPSYPVQSSEVLVRLRSIDTSELATLKHDDAAHWRHKVLTGVFGSDIEQYMSRRFLSILYLEPTASLGALGGEALLSVVRQLRSDTGSSNSVCVPQSYRDLLLVNGVLGDSSNWDLIAVRHKPLEESSDSMLAVPKSLLHLADIISLIHRLESAAKDLRSHPLLVESATEQVSRLLSPTRPRLDALRGRGWKRVVKAYDSHLSERLAGIEGRQAARRLSDEYSEAKAELNDNAKAKKDDWLWAGGALTSSPYAWGIVAHMRSDLERAGLAVSEATNEMEVRDAAIGDYTRDYLAAAGASSNMALQGAVFWLSVLALLIALVSLWYSTVEKRSLAPQLTHNGECKVFLP